MKISSKRFGRTIVIASVVFLSGCSSQREGDLPEIVQVERPIPYHIVRNGDTVGSIAEQYSMTRSTLIKLNKLTPPYQLYNGQRLVVHLNSEEKDSETEIIEQSAKTVRRGEEGALEENRRGKSTDKEEDEVIEIEDIDDVSAQANRQEATTDSPPQASEYVWPINDGQNCISQKFDSLNEGEVILKASAGTPVKSIAAGTVKVARILAGDASSYGKTVVILHNKVNKLSVYSHLQEISVSAKQKVKAGTIIGKMGKSGNAKTPQLHFQVFDVSGKKQKRVPIDPEKLLP
jgi:murein DD-endopeptidase MepM/ murein hydrolase activator NlpD